jgi:hypothetical protein
MFKCSGSIILLSLQESLSLEETPEALKRVIVEKELLLDLFTVCNVTGCGCVTDRDDVQMSTVGAAVIITVTCTNSHTFKWSSSPKVGDVPRKQMFLINILLASYALVCGLDIGQVSCIKTQLG